MRKILAGFLATSMVVSMATMASAATVKPSMVITPVQHEFAPANITGGTDDATTGTWTTEFTIEKLDIVLAGGIGTITVPVNKLITKSALSEKDGGTTTTLTFTEIDVTAADFATAVDGMRFEDQNINGRYYSGALKANGGTVNVVFDDNSAAIANLTTATAAWTMSPYKYSTTSQVNQGGAGLKVPTVTIAAPTVTAPTVGSYIAGNGGETIETEKDGDMTLVNVADILKCYPDGTPIPLTEKGTGVDKDLNSSGGVQSGQTVYFMVRDDSGAKFDKLEDDSFWGMKISKSNNGKYVKSTEDVTKIFSSDLYDANKASTTVTGTGDNKRHRYIKVVLNEIYTDDEYKVSLDVRLTAKDSAVRTGIVTKDETLLKVKDFSFWMKNIVKSADNDWTVGVGGLMLNPMLNDWNNVTYMDEENDVAFVRFFGDSDVGKFYAKLSTKWTHDDYAAYFNDQDAFYFEFTGSPKISSTSRADLQIYDPFTDIDGNSTFDSSTATIYQIVDGDLIDVTSSFTYGEGTNGENAFITRTRFLGSYIICEKPVEEAVGNEDIDDLMPGEEEIPVAPEMTPDNNAGGKNPANTGRYN